ncbi:hypothetical protein ATCC90586_009491 [Pythium insidiosum]|nr:hypothetical protein ATCC90586_009491 [Pythium insidiosum]
MAPTITEPPIAKATTEPSKRDAEVLRRNIERFVDGLMEEKHSLAELLNESFTTEMLDLLFKRMTAKLRAILFSRARTLELLRAALNPKLSRHTRSLATSFIISGGAVSCVVACSGDDHKPCLDFWETIFGAMHDEVQQQSSEPATVDAGAVNNGSTAVKPTDAAPTESVLAVEELEKLIQVEVKAIERDGAQSLHRSVVEQASANLSRDSGLSPRSRPSVQSMDEDEEDEHDSNRQLELAFDEIDAPPTPTSARTSVADDEDSVPSSTSSTGTFTFPTQQAPRCLGVFSADTANFSAQLLRYYAVRGQRGSCILHYLAQHVETVDLLLVNVGHDDTRTMLLHLMYSDHSEASMAALFKSGLLEKLVQRIVTFTPPRNAFERDCIENSFLLLREIIHAPYLTARGVAISAKTIPVDKITGQDEYVSICGASRELANSSMRKYTSRKVRHVVSLFLQHNQAPLEQLFSQMIKELTFWSSPVEGARQRKGSIANYEAQEVLSLLDAGHPRPTSTAMLTHLFELAETVDFAEEHTRNQGLNSTAAATSVGIDCVNYRCATHLVRSGRLLMKKKLRNELQSCEVSVNCMMGIRVTSLREEPVAAGGGIDSHFPVHSQGNQLQWTLDEVDAVESSTWHPHGFTITLKKAVPNVHSHEFGLSGMDSDLGDNAVRTDEYFAASSEEEKNEWIALLRAVINGDLDALEVFCSDDWRSNVREYRRLRECLITSMEHKGHEVMALLRQIVVAKTRQASGYHLWAIVKFLHAVLAIESHRLDHMFISAQLLDMLLHCYELYPTWNLLLGEITHMLIFVVGDFKNKRSRRCPIVGKLFVRGEGALRPLLFKAFIRENMDDRHGSPFYGTDTLSNLKLFMESLKRCYRQPKSRSQERIQTALREDPEWQRLLQAIEAQCQRHPEWWITSSVVSQLHRASGPSPSPTRGRSDSASSSSSSSSASSSGTPAPRQPSFHDHIISQITRPCYFSAHGFGSSFLLGDGCAFGYMFKERHHGARWQKVLLVYEYESHKLWYFYPSEVDESHHIQWKWVIPVGVRSRYTHGHDETHASVGHHGLFITAFDHHQTTHGLGHHTAATRELHLSVTKLEDRDKWKRVLGEAATQIQCLVKDYNARLAHLKKPDKKLVTHCQDPSCQQQFKLFRRPHSCKRCGKWFCGKCSQQRMAIPEVGLMHPVRHCRQCFANEGANDAMTEPSNLFRQSSNGKSGKTPAANRSSAGNGASKALTIDLALDDETRHSFSNVELFELAHGMVSPRSLLALRRRMNRQDSIDSPTHAFRIDEVEGHARSQHFFDGADSDGASDDSSSSSPPVSPSSGAHAATEPR